VSVVLITGVSRFLGGRLAAQLAADPQVERVIGIDAIPPRTADRLWTYDKFTGSLTGVVGLTDFVPYTRAG